MIIKGKATMPNPNPVKPWKRDAPTTIRLGRSHSKNCYFLPILIGISDHAGDREFVAMVRREEEGMTVPPSGAPCSDAHRFLPHQ